MDQSRSLRFSPRSRPPNGRLELAFRMIRGFVSKVKTSLAWTRLSVGCSEIILFRKINAANGKIGERSLMHTFHHEMTICSLSMVEQLPVEYLFGLLLHEFGHLGSGGGEREADRWILDNFGVRILYKGGLDLQCVDSWVARRIISAATPPRRNPHPHRRQSLRRRPARRPRPQAVPRR